MYKVDVTLEIHKNRRYIDKLYYTSYIYELFTKLYIRALNKTLMLKILTVKSRV